MSMTQSIATQFLLVAVTCLAFSACGGGGVDPAPAAARTSMSPEQAEREVYQRVNQYRRSRGLPEQALDARMSQLARDHSRRMASRGKLSHRGSDDRFSKLQGEPVQLISFAENVAFNLGHANPAEKAVDGWIGSSGHRRNMTRREDQLTGIGAAVAGDGSWYFTQLFGER